MAFSRLDITISSSNTLGIGDPIALVYDYTPPPFSGIPIANIARVTLFQTTRSTSWQATLDANYLVLSENYENALKADVPTLPYADFTISRVNNVITIQANKDGYVFYGATYTTGVTAVVTNEPFAPLFAITGYTLAPSLTPCATVSATLTVENGTPPYTWIFPNAGLTGLTQDLSRTGGNVGVIIEDSTSAQAEVSIYVPSSAPDLIQSIQVQTNPLGNDATVTAFINDEAEPTLTYEFSLNAVDWQPSNVFPSVLEGDYTLYVRDDYNCTTSQEFTVDFVSSVVVPDAFFDYSESNSIKWVLDTVAKDEISTFQNPDNTLYQNGKRFTGQYRPCWAQPFVKIDSVTTQFMTNYETLSAVLYDSTDTEADNYTIEKKITNIGIQDFRDAIVYDRGDGKTGLYFMAGNIYDSDDNIIDSYELNGQLPEWAEEGQVVVITSVSVNGTFQINQMAYDAEIGANIAVIDNIWSGAQNTEVARTNATYNRQNYDVYEFTSSFSLLTEGYYYMRITAIDSREGYPDVSVTSNTLNIKLKHKNHVRIRYSENPNDGMFYSTGIINRIWTPGIIIETGGHNEIVSITSAKSKLTKTKHTLVPQANFTIIQVPRYYMQKIDDALTHFSLELNGRMYQIDEPSEWQEPERTEMVSAKVKLKRTDIKQYQTDNIYIDEPQGSIADGTGLILQ